MIRCSRCLTPTTRPDTAFVDGLCSACLAYDQRGAIEWEGRKAELVRILDEHHGECLVASSGGKDSHYIALTLAEMGARVTVVTAATCHLTWLGRRNIDNLARHVSRTIEVTPNREVRAKLNRLGLELVGDISWPEHVSIFTTPFRVACEAGVPLIFYGESPQNQYGGPPGSQEAREMTRRWVSEFGGFLGLRPADMVGQAGITARDMAEYAAPPAAVLADKRVVAYFLGQFLPWDSHTNAWKAEKAGMDWKLPCSANLWPWENLDNAQTGLHDWFGWRKYGYGRACAQLSVDIRAGHVARKDAAEILKAKDGRFPHEYAGVLAAEALSRIGLELGQALEIAERFTNWDLFARDETGMARLKEWAC